MSRKHEILMDELLRRVPQVQWCIKPSDQGDCFVYGGFGTVYVSNHELNTAPLNELTERIIYKVVPGYRPVAITEPTPETFESCELTVSNDVDTVRIPLNGKTQDELRDEILRLMSGAANGTVTLESKRPTPGELHARLRGYREPPIAPLIPFPTPRSMVTETKPVLVFPVDGSSGNGRDVETVSTCEACNQPFNAYRINWEETGKCGDCAQWPVPPLTPLDDRIAAAQQERATELEASAVPHPWPSPVATPGWEG